MNDQIEKRLKEIKESIGEITPSFDREMEEYITQSRKDIPFLLALVKKQREALETVIAADDAALKYLNKESGIDWEGPIMGYAQKCRDALNFNPEAECR